MNPFAPRWPWWLTAPVGGLAVAWLVMGGGPLGEPPALARGIVVLAVLLAVDFAWERRRRRR
jgi:hypothetical protein